jgi:preprotein translocase subunit SecA
MGLKEGKLFSILWWPNLSNAHRKVEENNFGTRKRLLEYDDARRARSVYKRRRHALHGERLKQILLIWCNDTCEVIVDNKGANDFKIEFELIRYFTSPVSATSKLSATDLTRKILPSCTYYTEKTERSKRIFPIVQMFLKTKEINLSELLFLFVD